MSELILYSSDDGQKTAERAQADTEDLKEIEQFEHSIKHFGNKP